MLPKYFKNLHLCISPITGTPRIVNIDFDKTKISDKYKDIPKEEWESALLQYFQSFEENNSQLMILDDWSFFIGGKVENKEKLLKCLKARIEEIEKLED